MMIFLARRRKNLALEKYAPAKPKERVWFPYEGKDEVTKTPKTRKAGKDWESELLSAFKQSQKRLLLLDYDGTLVPHSGRSPALLPDKGLRRCLENLSANKNNTLAVLSSSNRTALATWFGEMPLTLIAENGAFCKRPGKTWETWPVMVSENMLNDLRGLITKFSERFPGSWVEAKESALVYHYRQCAPMLQLKARFMIKELLLEYTLTHGLKIVEGKSLVEIRPAALDKGIAYSYWMQHADWDFILGIGDDAGNEDLFAALPGSAWCIKVGKESSRAPLRLDEQKQVSGLLELLCKA